MLPPAPHRLANIVKSYDFDGLAGYIVERYETIIADSDMIDVLAYLGQGFVEACHGEHYLDCRLRRKLRLMGYFERMFGEAEVFDVHTVWNPLHWPWPDGLADRGYVPEREPNYTRSRLPRQLIAITPINSVALRVARPPTGPNALSKVTPPNGDE